MATDKIVVCIHPDDQDLLDALKRTIPIMEGGVPRPMGAELEITIAAIHLTAASIHLFCTIADRFSPREKSYVLMDGRQIALRDIGKELHRDKPNSDTAID